MRNTLILATAVLALALSQGATGAELYATNNDVVAGEVTKIDAATSRVTVRSADGQIHEFEASKQTLDDLKVGDHIEAKKRPDPK